MQIKGESHPEVRSIKANLKAVIELKPDERCFVGKVRGGGAGE